MKNPKKTARKRISVSRTNYVERTIGPEVRNRTLCNALTRRYKRLKRYNAEAEQIAAAIRALGGDPDA